MTLKSNAKLLSNDTFSLLYFSFYAKTFIVQVISEDRGSTPYVGGDQYYLTLEGISVGDTYVP